MSDSTQIKSTGCALPWTHLSTEANGSVRPCCIHQNKIPKNDHEFLFVDEVSLTDLMQTDFMKNLREEFRQNKKPEACHVCWKDEENGKESKRQMSLRFMQLDEKALEKLMQTEPLHPNYLQLVVTNHCNLKCRTCNPVASTKWITEGRDRGLYKYKFHENREIYRADSVLFQNQKEWLAHLEFLEIMGGEPFLQKDVENLLYEMVQSGFSKRIQVYISSNATLVPEKMIQELRPHFKYLGVSLSIDGIHDRFEYLRHGAEWNKVEQNLQKYYELALHADRKNLSSDFNVSLQITVSMLNIFYIPEVLQFFQTKFPLMKVSVNMVYYPIEFDCVHLPKKIKKLVRAEFEKFKSKSFWSTLSSILNHLEREVADFFTFQVGLVALLDGDQYRKESFAKTFPEYFSYFETEWEQMKKDYSFIKMTAQRREYLMIDNSLQRKQDLIFKKNIQE